MTVGRALCPAALAVLLAGAISGCGGVAGQSGAGVATISGRTVFAEHCADCHSISGHLARHQQGGDLRGLRLPRSELVQFTVEMPAIHGRLRPREVRAVVDYMRSMARRR